MSADPTDHRRPDLVLAGGGILMVLCCAVGPAVIGAVAGSAIGGWLGIACAVLAAIIGVVRHEHRASQQRARVECATARRGRRRARQAEQ